MDDSNNHETSPSIYEFLGFDCQSNLKPRNNFVDFMKSSLVQGADKVLMSKTPRTLLQFDSEHSIVKGNCTSQETNNKVRLEPNNSLLKSRSKRVGGASNFNIDDTIDVSEVVVGYNVLPLINIVTFLAVFFFRMVSFQMDLFIRFFMLPIRLSYFSIMLVLFPFQTLSRIRAKIVKGILEMWFGFYLSVASFICTKIKAQRIVLNLAIRIGWACFWSMYVCFLLVGLLVSGFIIGGLTMRRLVEEPIQTTEALNFDYTRPSPIAFVPIMSSHGGGYFSGSMYEENVEAGKMVDTRVIPYNHKLQLSVSLTLPESEYNRNLGVFQVRVEFLSLNGKVTASSSYPCMLKFKSQSIRFAETMFKTIPLVTGFRSELQIVNVKFSKFTEGLEPTACLRVTLEQRAEYKAGAGIPEIYSASLALESELPPFKRIIWLWRRTIFVWISMITFLMELMVILIFCRPLYLRGGRRKSGAVIRGEKKNVKQNKISWKKKYVVR